MLGELDFASAKARFGRNAHRNESYSLRIATVEPTNPFGSGSSLSAHLRLLRRRRRETSESVRGGRARAPLSAADRERVLMKTDGRCHICGGVIDGEWQADHILSHALGGDNGVGNFLPAHRICNQYRWSYGSEEFQWILKLGVWLRTQIELKTEVGKQAAEAFCARERVRIKRRRRSDEVGDESGAPNLMAPPAALDQ